MEIRVEEVKGFDTNKEIIIIEERIKETLNNHPFLEGLDKPDLVRVWVKKEEKENTQINHRLFSEWCVVILYLLERDIRPYYPGGAFGVHELDREKIDKVLYHEFGHFIDARLDPAFGYKDEEHKGKWYAKIYTTLWNCYIDGRLEKFKLAPCSLKERIDLECVVDIDSKRIEIKSDFLTKAWNREFRTHEELLYKSKEAYKESKK